MSSCQNQEGEHQKAHTHIKIMSNNDFRVHSIDFFNQQNVQKFHSPCILVSFSKVELREKEKKILAQNSLCILTRQTSNKWAAAAPTDYLPTVFLASTCSLFSWAGKLLKVSLLILSLDGVERQTQRSELAKYPAI